jgi:hypothetical protein
VRAQEPVAVGADAQVGVGLGAAPEHVGVAQQRHDRHVLLFVPAAGQLAAVDQPLVLLGPAPAPRLHVLGQPREIPRVAGAHAPAGRGGQRHALEEDALVGLQRQVGAEQVAPGADARDDLGDARLDVVVAERPRDRHAVVAVLDEVDLADLVEVDRRHRLAAAHRGRDALPARPHLRGRGAEVAVKALHPVDGPDDGVQRHDALAHEALLHAAQRADDLLERQDVVDVARLAPQPSPQPRQGEPAACSQEVVLGVGSRQTGGARWHTRKVPRVGTRVPSWRSRAPHRTTLMPKRRPGGPKRVDCHVQPCLGLAEPV